MFWKCIYSHYLVTETLCGILLYICLSNLTNDIESSMIIGHSHQTKLIWHYCPQNTTPTLPSCLDKRDEGRCLSLLREVKRALSHQQETCRKRITFHNWNHLSQFGPQSRSMLWGRPETVWDMHSQILSSAKPCSIFFMDFSTKKSRKAYNSNFLHASRSLTCIQDYSELCCPIQ